MRDCFSIVIAVVLAASCGGSTNDSTSPAVGTAGNGNAGSGGSGNRAGSGNASGTGGSGNASGSGATDGGATGGSSNASDSSATGGSGNASGSAGAGNISGTGVVDASNDGPPPADGAFACGSTTCQASEFCIHPCCGGPPPPCMAMPEAGTCPSGWHSGCSFSSGQCSNVSACCEMDPCTPPPPYCSATTFGGCLAEGRDCYLLCA